MGAVIPPPHPPIPFFYVLFPADISFAILRPSDLWSGKSAHIFGAHVPDANLVCFFRHTKRATSAPSQPTSPCCLPCFLSFFLPSFFPSCLYGNHKLSCWPFFSFVGQRAEALAKMTFYVFRPSWPSGDFPVNRSELVGRTPPTVVTCALCLPVGGNLLIRVSVLTSMSRMLLSGTHGAVACRPGARRLAEATFLVQR